MNDEIAWTVEERLWREGVEAMAKIVDAECVMVFPAPVGILTGKEILHSLEGVPHWTDIDMTERTAVRPTEDLLVLAYRAEGWRGDADPYVAYSSSVYRRDGAHWWLVHHQQTPSG